MMEEYFLLMAIVSEQLALPNIEYENAINKRRVSFVLGNSSGNDQRLLRTDM